MDRTYRFRTGLVVALLFLITAVFTIRLFSLQLTENETNTYGSTSTTTYELRVSSARGELMDRHGTVLVHNRATYNVIINSFVLYNSDDPNGNLLLLAETCEKNGIEYKDSLPLTNYAPYSYDYENISASEEYVYKRFLIGREWDADMTAENLAKKLRDVYNIGEEYTERQARMIMGLRYELDLPSYAYADTYTLAEDVSAEQLAILKELAIPGMDVTTTTVREYNTAFAAQLLGHVGLMTAEEYEEIYEAKGYAMDATVGKEGFEEAFEEYLHGTDGVKVVTVTADGTVVDEYWKVEPKSGANVMTSIDIGLQEVAEKSLEKHITALAEQQAEGEKDGYDANAGAVVVMDVDNFEVLCSANYPTYDPRDYDYNELLNMEVSPLANRALMYAYPPGSTFKMITSIAALRSGVSPARQVEGTGTFSFDDGTTLACWIWTQYRGAVHGKLDMRGALANSCNIYFYTVGMDIGITAIESVAKDFGVGEDTGAELINNSGTRANREAKAAAYSDPLEANWFEADTATAAIGQSLTQMTPLQLCRYVACIANKGTMYRATFLRRAVSSDFQSLVADNDYTPMATNLISAYEWQIIYDGMRLCVTEGTGKDLSDYPIAVCAKTGTAQHGTGGSDHGAFVCWAPADDPEIAIAVYVEHGASGSNFAEVAADVMDYYFNTKDMVQELELEDDWTED